MLGARSTWRRLVVAAVVVPALVIAMTSPWRSHSMPSTAAAVDGISLLPAAGQFTPLPGTPILDSRNGTGLSAPNLAPGSTLTFSVTTVGSTATGVPANASAVVLEYNTQANFAGVLSTGSAAGATDTSLTFPASVERNGFDIGTPASDGTVALAITGFSPIPSGAVLSRLVVRLHGYYSGASTSTAGSTYVGYDPALLASSSSSPSGFTKNGTATSGPLTIGSGSYTVQVTGNAGVPGDGSATAVALQTIVQDPTCSGGFSLTPAGSGRSDYDGSFTNGQDDENFDLIALPSSGQLSLQLLGCTGNATVTIRVRGYYSAPTATTPGASFVPTQRKVFDTTTGTGTSSCPTTADSPKLAAHSGCTIQVLGTGGIPSAGVSGLAAQVVAVDPGHDGWLGLYSDDNVAHTATLWYSPTDRTSNFEVASYTDVSPDGTVYVWNGGDYAVDIVIRAHGYYAAPALPGVPGAVTVATNGSSTTVSWTAPTTDGGAAIGGFVVEGEDQSGTFVDWPATSTSFSSSQGDVGYSVSAVNGVGVGTPGLSGCDAWRGTLPTPSPADTTSPDPVDSTPVAGPSKQAALSATPSQTALPSPSASLVVACASSIADATTVAAIKADALNDLHLDLYAMRQPTNSSGQLLAEYPSQEGTVTDSTTMNVTLQSEAHGAGSAWSSAQAAAQVSQRYQDARAAYADPDYVGYTDAKTVADQWQSVRLTSPTTATAAFVGHDSFRSTTGWHDDQAFQFQLALVLENGHWRLASRDEIDLGLDAPDN